MLAVQETTFPEAEQPVPCVEFEHPLQLHETLWMVALTKVTPAGSTSLTTTEEAAFLPRFTTTMSYGIGSDFLADHGAILTIPRSTEEETTVYGTDDVV